MSSSERHGVADDPTPPGGESDAGLRRASADERCPGDLTGLAELLKHGRRRSFSSSYLAGRSPERGNAVSWRILGGRRMEPGAVPIGHGPQNDTYHAVLEEAVRLAVDLLEAEAESLLEAPVAVSNRAASETTYFM